MPADPREPAGSTLFTAQHNPENDTAPAFTSSAIRRLKAAELSDVAAMYYRPQGSLPAFMMDAETMI